MPLKESVLLLDRNLRVTGQSQIAFPWLAARESLSGCDCREVFQCDQCQGASCPVHRALKGEQAEGVLPSRDAFGTLVVAAAPLHVGTDRLVLLRVREEELELEPPDTGLPDLNAGLRGILDGLREMLHADLAALASYDESRREVRWQVTSGNMSASLSEIRLRPGQGFAGRIVLNSEPLATSRFADLTIDPESYPIFLAEGLEAAVGVPVSRQGRVLGVLMIANRTPREYTRQDREMLAHIASSISLASEMFRLYGKAVDTERARLAEEVHDGLSQNLFGLQLLIADLQENIESDSPAAVKQGVQRVCRVLDSTLTEVRRLVADLRGSRSADLGLVASLSDYLGYFSRLSRLQVELALRLAPEQEVDCEAPHEVLRIVQEALMNVHRHAAAERVRIEVTAADDAYALTITDDGRGFDPHSPVPGGHFGLSIMRERAERFGGELGLKSAIGEGTRVCLRIPRLVRTAPN